jgi:signal transduction histidine kinase
MSIDALRNAPLFAGLALEGLHIAYSVVSRHGGRIEVASGPGRTCFRVSLPAILERPRDEPPLPSEEPG